MIKIQREAPHLADDESIHRRLVIVEMARKWAGEFSEAPEPVRRESMVGRLHLERRLGELIDPKRGRPSTTKQTNKNVIPDDSSLPEWVSRNLSSNSQVLAEAPKPWFNTVVRDIKSGERRKNINEIYLEARRMVAAKKAEERRREAEAEAEKRRAARKAAQRAKAKSDPGTKAEDQTAESDAEREESKAESEPESGGPLLDAQIVLGDFREIGSRIADESIGLVFTDPPYDRASVGLYGDVARLAARVLLPGGSLILYAPNYLLPEVLTMCGEHLRYWWTLAFLLPGDHALMREYGVRVAWKPLVWFTKGGRFNKQELFNDAIQGMTKEKGEHEWQQQELAARELIGSLTTKNDLVLDPMCGSATTLLAAKALGRRWLGIEVKPETAALARERLERS